MKCITIWFHFCSWIMLPQSQPEVLFSVICKNLLIRRFFCPWAPFVLLCSMQEYFHQLNLPYLRHCFEQVASASLPWILPVNPRWSHGLPSSLRSKAVALSLPPQAASCTQVGHRTSFITTCMDGATPPSITCLMAWFLLNKAFSHILFVFTFPRLWPFCTFKIFSFFTCVI
jgi:hypothetical protein